MGENRVIAVFAHYVQYLQATFDNLSLRLALHSETDNELLVLFLEGLLDPTAKAFDRNSVRSLVITLLEESGNLVWKIAVLHLIEAQVLHQFK